MRSTAKFLNRLLPVFFFILYFLTVQSGVSWQDSGFLQWRIYYKDIIGEGDIALSHPLYIWLGHWFSGTLSRFLLVEAPTASNIMSALWMALTLRVFFRVAYALSKSVTAAALATLTFGFAHMTWWLSTITEIYTMSLFFIACEIDYTVRVLRDKELNPSAWIGVAISSGLGFAVHNFSLLSLPVTFAALLFRGIRYTNSAGNKYKNIKISFTLILSVISIFIWTMASSPIWKLAISAKINGAATLSVIKSILVGQYGGAVAGGGTLSWKYTLFNLAIASFSFLLPCWWIFIKEVTAKIRAEKGILNLIKKISGDISAEMVYILALLLVHGLFFVRYRVPDQALFLLPTLLITSLLLAKVLGNVKFEMPYSIAGGTVLAALVVPLAVNFILHITPIENKILSSRARLLPYRDELRYWVLPWKHNETSAEDFAEKVISVMNQTQNSSLYADSTSAPPVLLRFSDREALWELYTPWTDISRYLIAIDDENQECFVVSKVSGYCPDKALKSKKVRQLFLNQSD